MGYQNIKHIADYEIKKHHERMGFPICRHFFDKLDNMDSS